MTFRRLFSLSVLGLAALFGFAACDAPATAQPRAASRRLLLQRGVLPSRGLGRSHSVSYRTTSARLAPRPVELRLNFGARRAAPNLRAPNLSAPALSAPDLTAPGSLAPASIALGAYFYQNGQCAPGDDAAVSAWRARAGRLPAVWMIFQGWTGWNAFPIAQARRAQQLGGRLLVTWEPWSGARGAANWNCALIAGGAKDAYIRQYARAVKTAGVPVMIRFAHEMNGDWYPWGTAFRSNFRRNGGNSPAQYVAMWRRVVGIFRSEGASNAQWVWAPNIQYLNRYNSEFDQRSDLAALYPGDGFVNWIGLSVYNDTSKQNWRSFSDLFEGTYRTLTAISSRPLMIAEMGATEAGAPHGTSKAAWISQTLMRDIPTRYPRVRLVNWFCRDKSNVGEANYRFDSSPGALQAFRVAVNSPLYGARLSSD